MFTRVKFAECHPNVTCACFSQHSRKGGCGHTWEQYIKHICLIFRSETRILLILSSETRTLPRIQRAYRVQLFPDLNAVPSTRLKSNLLDVQQILTGDTAILIWTPVTTAKRPEWTLSTHQFSRMLDLNESPRPDAWVHWYQCLCPPGFYSFPSASHSFHAWVPSTSSTPIIERSTSGLVSIDLQVSLLQPMSTDLSVQVVCQDIVHHLGLRATHSSYFDSQEDKSFPHHSVTRVLLLQESLGLCVYDEWLFDVQGNNIPDRCRTLRWRVMSAKIDSGG